MLLKLASSRKILFFGGKGGVGKTTVSAATALAAADQGKNVLLVSTDPAHNLGHLFDRRIGPKPVKLASGLDGLELDPEKTVDRHLEEVTAALRRMMPAHLSGEIDKHMELSRDAPGMQEAAMLERIAEVIEQASDYDLVVFDTAPSGHTARLMALPEMMSAWTEGLIKRRDKADSFSAVLKSLARDSSVGANALGDEPAQQDQDRESRIRRLLNRRKQRFAGLRDALSDAGKTGFVIVLAAERLPVLETIELHAQLVRAGVDVAGLVVNKRLPDGLQGFLAERKSQEDIHLATLNDSLGQVTRQDLQLAPADVLGVDALRAFASQF
ncbi:ArsA family ATPase [Pseudohongiella sp. SYSU M77423]|uniref:ArsA family ATPase n=1 Tax=unclassified Pseudohongiella TaxID=2629611 RepID=UPI001F38A258|nr:MULTISPECIES: ArsA family ATPase [unclassified Pseudohongiella]MDH7944063.1 ArsA family ATPase [Pseudohongiella sp. SYSU M77423]MEC8861173.1 ArsA family ATPase [Pseudomonadota bacterium]